MDTKPDIIFLQETLGIGSWVKATLESLLWGWTFEVIDLCGQSGGLVVGWLDRTRCCENILGSESVMGLEVFSSDMDTSLLVVNIYGPYIDQIPF